MNLFFLHDDAREAARMQSDVHVVKMILETMQMLCTAIHYCKTPFVFPFVLYKPTHVNHPSTKWIRHTLKNFMWALEHGHELCIEYTKRYGKIHKCQPMYEELLKCYNVLDFKKLSKNEYDLKKVSFNEIPNDVGFITIAIADDILSKCAVYDSNHKLLGISTYKNYYIYKTTSLKRPMRWYQKEQIPDCLTNHLDDQVSKKQRIS